MKKIELRQLNIKDEENFFKAFNESWESNFDFVHYWESIAEKDFKKYISLAPDFPKGLHIPGDHVAATLLFAFNEEDQIVGRTSIRHELNDHLLQVGGHVGYGVCPSFRRQGYATLILKESIEYIKNHIPTIKDKILVTCDEGNIGSKKTIESNRGILENIINTEGVGKMRYWIHL